MLGSSDSDIDAILILYKLASIRANHRNEYKIELTALRRVDGEDLVIRIILWKVLSDRIFLCIIRGDNVDRVLVELHNGYLRILFLPSLRFREAFETKVPQLNNYIDFLQIVVGSAFAPLDTIRNVNE